MGNLGVGLHLEGHVSLPHLKKLMSSLMLIDKYIPPATQAIRDKFFQG
jgi:hypothetical protein